MNTLRPKDVTMSAKTRKVVFAPQKVQKIMKVVQFEMPIEDHVRVKAAAKLCGVPIKDFIVESIQFAMNHLDLSKQDD